MIKKTNTSVLQILVLVLLGVLANPAYAKLTKLMSYNDTDFYVELETIKQGWTIVSYRLL